MEFIAVVEHMFRIYKSLHTDTSTQIQTLRVVKSLLSNLLPNNNSL